MTAIVAIENCGLDDELEVGAESCGIEGSSMYLHLGQCVTVEDLLYGLLLVSGNDAADALARYTAGSIEDFAALMNEKAQNLGMTNSSFSNPHGLDAEDHYSTARDMAVLMDYCMRNEDFARIISASSRQVGEQCYYNHNKLLWRCERLHRRENRLYARRGALPCELLRAGRDAAHMRHAVRPRRLERPLQALRLGFLAVFRPQSAERRLITGGTGDVRD